MLQCGHSQEMKNQLLLPYIDSKAQSCDICAASFDAWECVRSGFTIPGAMWFLLGALGGRRLISQHRLKRDEIWELNLDSLGVPPDADIRSVNLSAQTATLEEGVTFPALLFGNQPRVAKLPHQMNFFLMSSQPNTPPTTLFNLHVEFIEPQQEIHRALLVGSANAHGDADYRRAVIDAHTAADTALLNALTRRTGGLVSSKSRMSFLDKVAVVAALRNELGLASFPTRDFGNP